MVLMVGANNRGTDEGGNEAGEAEEKVLAIEGFRREEVTGNVEIVNTRVCEVQV